MAPAAARTLSATSSFLGAAVPLPQARRGAAPSRRRAAVRAAAGVPLPSQNGGVYTGVQQLHQLAAAPAAASPAGTVVPVALAAGLAGAGVASLLAGGKKRVYGKGLAQFLPNDASALAKNIAYHAEFSATTTSLTTDKLKARAAQLRRRP